jgi:hypothetical protein
MVVAGLAFGGLLNTANAGKNSELIAEANRSIEAAASAVEEAKAAIQNGKQFVAMIPQDSEVMEEVVQMLKDVKASWVLAVAALDGAKASASKISSASSPEIAQDYKLLASVNAGVALSGAEVVKTGITFVHAAANGKSESLEIIRTAMQDSLEAAAQVQYNYERVKTLIAEKYSK